MKYVWKVIFPALLALLLLGCAGQPVPGNSSGEGAETGSLTDSYYAAQESGALSMLKKSIFQDMLADWAEGGGDDARWEYDTFTRYESGEDSGQDLYCCAYSGGGRYGFVVLAYDGDSLSRIRAEETPCFYDLRPHLDAVAALAEDAGLELSSAEASRVRLDGASGGEGLRIADGRGAELLLRFGESAVEEL